MSETLSTTNMPPPRNNCLCADKFLSQKWPHIVAALSVIILLGAIFTLLAAYKLVPPESNLVSNYAWSKTLGFGFMAVGILTGIVAILGRLCPPNRRPSHVVEVNEPNVSVQRGRESVLIPFSLHNALTTWASENPDRKEFEKRYRAIDSIIDCYAGKEERLSLYDLTSLPDIFAHLGHIRSLTLNCCSSSLVLQARVYKLKNLEDLTVSNLKLDLPNNEQYWSVLFNQISELKMLRSLTLIKNSIIKLPDSIKGFENLTELNLMGNSLTELPQSYGQLTRLEALYLSQNQLVSLPDWLFELPAIRMIDATENLFSPEIVTSLCEKVKPLIAREKITVFNASNPSHAVDAYKLLDEVHFPPSE